MDAGGTICDALEAAARRWGNRTAVAAADGRVGFAELEERARAVAKGVIAAGLEPGERFAIWAPNSLDWQLAALGGQLAGGALVPVNTRFKSLEAGDILRRSGSRLVFTAGEFLGTDYAGAVQALAAGDPGLPSVRQQVLLGAGAYNHSPPEGEYSAGVASDGGGSTTAASTSSDAGSSASALGPPTRQRLLRWRTPPQGGSDSAALQRQGLVGLEGLVAAGEEVGEAALEARIAGVKGEAISDILYTSGTTGAPKGVMTSHGQNVAVFRTWAAGVTLGADDRYLIVNPYFHAFGYKAGWLAGLLTGACIYPMPVFDVDAALELIEAEGISFLPGPPTLFQSLLAHPQRGKRQLGSLRCAVTGAAAVPVQLVKDMKGELGFAEVYTAYGLTESTGVVSLCRPGDDFETIASTSGRAIEGVEVRIADADGQALPAGELGEVWVRGFNVMQGYLDDPEATAAAITPEGWLRTGDLGTMDPRGYLAITDRLKDMYICGGFNCYPAEIEKLLLGHPGVADVAVLGVPDTRLGEVGHAFTVAAPGAERDTAGVLEWAREQMANYKAPRGLTWVEELPRNAGGKVQKFLLREQRQL